MHTYGPFKGGCPKLSAYQSLFRNKSPQPVLTSSMIRMQRSLFIFSTDGYHVLNGGMSGSIDRSRMFTIITLCA